ncbi:MAG: SGNH/GDSL hydrolase family protein, partial [bacterium]|nr:SGNH/GDSL hydrolase family protein [bacterium]
MIKNIVWIVLGVILVVTLYQTLRIRRLISIGKELAASAVAYEQVPARADRSILVVGDSSAIGVGAGMPEESVAGRL